MGPNTKKNDRSISHSPSSTKNTYERSEGTRTEQGDAAVRGRVQELVERLGPCCVKEMCNSLTKPQPPHAASRHPTPSRTHDTHPHPRTVQLRKVEPAEADLRRLEPIRGELRPANLGLGEGEAHSQGHQEQGG